MSLSVCQMEEPRRSIVGEKSSVIPGLGMEGSLDNRCEEGEGAGMTGPQEVSKGKIHRESEGKKTDPSDENQW